MSEPEDLLHTRIISREDLEKIASDGRLYAILDACDEPAVLEVRGARRSYGAVDALRGVDLRIARGEVLALLGPNGAGKTTLLRAVSGRLALDAGSVRLMGRDPRTEPEPFSAPWFWEPAWQASA